MFVITIRHNFYDGVYSLYGDTVIEYMFVITIRHNFYGSVYSLYGDTVIEYVCDHLSVTISMSVTDLVAESVTAFL